MGLKDWFGGAGAKKSQFREKLKDAVSDGRLTPEKLAEIEALRQELDTSGAADDKTQYRREVFNTAVSAVKAGGRLTPTEEAELAKIQRFLALKDSQVDKTKMDLGRLRLLTEIAKNNLPTVSSGNTVLRGVSLGPGEIAHYSVASEAFDSSTDPAAFALGSRMILDARYSPGAGRAFGLPTKGAVSLGEGFAIVTSKRIVFKGPQPFAMRYTQLNEIYLYRDGLRLKIKSMSMQRLLKLRDESSVDVVAAIIANLESGRAE